MKHRIMFLMIILAVASSTYGANLSIGSKPYLTGGLFTSPVLPQEGEAVALTVRAECEGKMSAPVSMSIVIRNAAGKAVFEKNLSAKIADKVAEGTISWQTEKNGLYRVKVTLDPQNKIAETNEKDNQAELTLPVVKRKLHFAWYREVPTLRWTTCVTSMGKDSHQRLSERGVIGLNWAFGGKSWSYYDKKKAKDNPKELFKDVEARFYKMYTNPAKTVTGYGIDETGGYPGSFSEQMSIASMKALVRAKKAMPERFFAVWHGGGLRKELAQYYRQGADLLLLETYIWRAIPQDLGAEDIYATIRDRLDPLARSADMIVPAYGNPCYTLIALDTSERSDYIDVGEQEQVVRFIRRICPEMRGIAWYNGGYGGYGLKRTKQTDKHHQAVLTNADRLCFEYYVKPCVTLMRESLWLSKNANDKWELTLAVNNIGGIDSGPVEIEFLVDGKSTIKTIDSIPAGKNRIHNRVFVKQLLSINPGLHRFGARIIGAPGSTVLDPMIELSRMVP